MHTLMLATINCSILARKRLTNGIFIHTAVANFSLRFFTLLFPGTGCFSFSLALSFSLMYMPLEKTPRACYVLTMKISTYLITYIIWMQKEAVYLICILMSISRHTRLASVYIIEDQRTKVYLVYTHIMIKHVGHIC